MGQDLLAGMSASALSQHQWMDVEALEGAAGVRGQRAESSHSPEDKSPPPHQQRLPDNRRCGNPELPLWFLNEWTKK